MTTRKDICFLFNLHFSLIITNRFLSINLTFAGSVVVIVVSVLSAVVVFMVGIAIGIYICKHRTIQKKRRGQPKFLISDESVKIRI